MRLLILGSRGFLGKFILNNISRFQNLEVWAPTSKDLNLLDANKSISIISDYKPEIILHASAKCGGILANKNSPADFIRDNTQMGLNVYEAARVANIKYVYSLGSVCQYPKYCPTPFKEDDIWNGSPEESNKPYGQAKRTLLMLSQTYRQQYGIGGAFLIPTNLFGPKDNIDPINSHVVPAIIRKTHTAIKNDSPTIECWGTGEISRELLYVEDCAEAIVQAIVRKLDTALPINLGVGKEIFIKDLVKLIANLMNFKGKIIFTGEVSDGQPRRMLDVSRAKELLNWSAKTSLEDGLIKTIEWYKSLNE